MLELRVDPAVLQVQSDLLLGAFEDVRRKLVHLRAHLIRVGRCKGAVQLLSGKAPLFHAFLDELLEDSVVLQRTSRIVYRVRRRIDALLLQQSDEVQVFHGGLYEHGIRHLQAQLAVQQTLLAVVEDAVGRFVLNRCSLFELRPSYGLGFSLLAFQIHAVQGVDLLFHVFFAVEFSFVGFLFRLHLSFHLFKGILVLDVLLDAVDLEVEIVCVGLRRIRLQVDVVEGCHFLRKRFMRLVELVSGEGKDLQDVAL